MTPVTIPYTSPPASEVGTAGDRGRRPVLAIAAPVLAHELTGAQRRRTDDTTSRPSTTTTPRRHDAPGVATATTSATATDSTRRSVPPPRRVRAPRAAPPVQITPAAEPPSDPAPPVESFRRPANPARPTVVYSKSQQTVWAFDENDTIIKMHRVSGKQDPLDPARATYRVWSRSISTYSINNPSITWGYMVRFAKGAQGGNIGFHEIPYQYGTTRADDRPARPGRSRVAASARPSRRHLDVELGADRHRRRRHTLTLDPADGPPDIHGPDQRGNVADAMSPSDPDARVDPHRASDAHVRSTHRTTSGGPRRTWPATHLTIATAVVHTDLGDRIRRRRSVSTLANG